jgi:hypothetical protein
MLGLGSVTSAWDLLSSLQAQQLAASGAAAGGAGVSRFAPGGPNGQNPAPNGWTFAPPPSQAGGQNPLSPDVLGFLIWNQSQQSTGTPGSPGTTTGATANTGPTVTANTPGPAGPEATTGSAAWTPFQGLFAQFAADGSVAQSQWPAVFGGNNTAAGNPLNAIPTNWDAIDPNEPAATQNSGGHGHHHHHAGLAELMPPDGSNPLAGLLGTAAPGASSATTANPDGSTTTTITYADGSEVTVTTPAQVASANAATVAAAPAPPLASPNNFLEMLIRLQAQQLTPAATA